MKISELIVILSKIQSENGDLDVCEKTNTENGLMIYDIDETDLMVMKSRYGFKFLNIWAY